MQIDLLQELPPNGGMENFITAIIIYSRYAFAYLVSSPTAVNSAKVIFYIMTRHAYLPSVMMMDNGCFRFKCDTRNSWCPRHHIPACNHEACTNYRTPRKKACNKKDIAEKVFRGISQAMAQIFTFSSFKLQQNVSHEYRI